MQWKLPKRHSYTNPSTVSFSTMASGGNSSGSYENSLASTGGSSGRDRAFIQHPFGAGVAFDSPVRKTPRVKRNGSEGSVIRPLIQETQVPVDPDPASNYPSRLVMPTSNIKMLREMQSFESTMTARQYDIIESETARGTPTADFSPWDKIDYHHLLDTYDDNPNLKRPPSAVWLKPGTSMTVILNGGSGPSLPETPEVANDTPLVDTAPSTPVVTPVSVSVMNDDDDNDQVIPVNEALRAFISIPQDDKEAMAAAGPTSRYTSTPDVFDVLQTFTGLPLLDRLPTGKRSTDASGEGGGGGVPPLKAGEDIADNDNDNDDDDDDLMVETTVIRMSLTTKEESAAPRDDPRFVIWGWVNDVVSSQNKKEVEEGVKEKKKTRRSWRGSLLSGSEGDSPSDHEGSRKSRPSLGSRRRSKKDKSKARQGANEFGVVVVEDHHHHHPSNNSQEENHTANDEVPTSENKKKVLIAATIERWVAQLTSEIDYDELLVFFLTYRTYVSAIDLCRVLFGRFYWALRGGEDDGEDGEQRTTNPKVCDDRVRRIVRVRTFVAIRYWLIQFWHVDFVPNRELRLLMADCLNQLNRDPLLKKHVDGLVRVSDCADSVFLPQAF